MANAPQAGDPGPDLLLQMLSCRQSKPLPGPAPQRPQPSKSQTPTT